MKKALRIGVLVVCGASLSACAAIHTSEVAARRVSPDYTVTPGDTSGVIAFGYGGRTVLEFKSIPVFLSIKDEQGANVEYEREGRYARLSRKLGTFTASMNGDTVIFTALQPLKVVAPAVKAKPALPVKLVAVSPQDQSAYLTVALNKMRQELHEIKKNLATIKVVPANAQELHNINARLDQIAGQFNSSSATVLKVTFPSYSMEFKPSPEVAQALILAAKAAYQVNLRGRTDANIAGPDDPSIALGRALSARKYLVDRGIDSEKIHVFSKADGDFIAPNGTKEGRAMNRRVEIEIMDYRLVAVAKEVRGIKQ